MAKNPPDEWSQSPIHLQINASLKKEKKKNTAMTLCNGKKTADRENLWDHYVDQIAKTGNDLPTWENGPASAKWWWLEK